MEPEAEGPPVWSCPPGPRFPLCAQPSGRHHQRHQRLGNSPCLPAEEWLSVRHPWTVWPGFSQQLDSSGPPLSPSPSPALPGLTLARLPEGAGARCWLPPA